MTEQDFLNIIYNKINNEAQKALIRKNYPADPAQQLCGFIDRKEKTELFQKLCDEMRAYQLRQQQIIQAYIRQM